MHVAVLKSSLGTLCWVTKKKYGHFIIQTQIIITTYDSCYAMIKIEI